MNRFCERCRVSEDDEMLALNGKRLVCQECDSAIDREYVEADPENRRHYLDTFSPKGD